MAGAARGSLLFPETAVTTGSPGETARSGNRFGLDDGISPRALPSQGLGELVIPLPVGGQPVGIHALLGKRCDFTGECLRSGQRLAVEVHHVRDVDPRRADEVAAPAHGAGVVDQLLPGDQVVGGDVVVPDRVGVAGHEEPGPEIRPSDGVLQGREVDPAGFFGGRQYPGAGRRPAQGGPMLRTTPRPLPMRPPPEQVAQEREPVRTESPRNIGEALEFLSRVTRRRSVVFLVSDFMSSGYEKALQIANKRHDMVSITLTDPREIELPNVGFIELEDAETGETFLVDTSSIDVRNTFTENTNEAIEEREKHFRSLNFDYIDIRTDQSYIEPLMRFFRMRAKRFR